MILLLAGSQAIAVTRPDIAPGPMERSLSDLSCSGVACWANKLAVSRQVESAKKNDWQNRFMQIHLVSKAQRTQNSFQCSLVRIILFDKRPGKGFECGKTIRAFVATCSSHQYTNLHIQNAVCAARLKPERANKIRTNLRKRSCGIRSSTNLPNQVPRMATTISTGIKPKSASWR